MSGGPASLGRLRRHAGISPAYDPIAALFGADPLADAGSGGACRPGLAARHAPAAALPPPLLAHPRLPRRSEGQTVRADADAVRLEPRVLSRHHDPRWAHQRLLRCEIRGGALA